MQKVTILCTGKLKEKFYLDAVAEYVKRLNRFCKLEIIELPEERLPEDPSPAQIEAALSKEADAVRAKLPNGCLVIAMWKGGNAPARSWPAIWRTAPPKAPVISSFSSAAPSECTNP